MRTGRASQRKGTTIKAYPRASITVLANMLLTAYPSVRETILLRWEWNARVVPTQLVWEVLQRKLKCAKELCDTRAFREMPRADAGVFILIIQMSRFRHSISR